MVDLKLTNRISKYVKITQVGKLVRTFLSRLCATLILFLGTAQAQVDADGIAQLVEEIRSDLATGNPTQAP